MISCFPQYIFYIWTDQLSATQSILKPQPYSPCNMLDCFQSSSAFCSRVLWNLEAWIFLAKRKVGDSHDNNLNLKNHTPSSGSTIRLLQIPSLLLSLAISEMLLREIRTYPNETAYKLMWRRKCGELGDTSPTHPIHLARHILEPNQAIFFLLSQELISCFWKWFLFKLLIRYLALYLLSHYPFLAIFLLSAQPLPLSFACHLWIPPWRLYAERHFLNTIHTFNEFPHVHRSI